MKKQVNQKKNINNKKEFKSIKPNVKKQVDIAIKRAVNEYRKTFEMLAKS